MELFQLKDYNLTFLPQTLALEPFKALFDADKSKDKHRAIMELSYVYFFADGRSDFVDIVDKEERSKEVASSLSLPEDWKPSKLVEDAIAFYLEREETVSSKLLKSCLIATDKMGKFLEELNLSETDEKGKLVHNVKQINDTIKQVPATIKSLIEAQREIKKEKESKSGARGSIQKGMMEDGE